LPDIKKHSQLAKLHNAEPEQKKVHNEKVGKERVPDGNVLRAPNKPSHARSTAGLLPLKELH